MRLPLAAITIVLVCSLIAGCTGHRYPQALRVADSLTDEQPDSSLLMLQAMEPRMADMPEVDCMYYQLLCIKAADKCDRLKPDTLEILTLVDYYKDRADSLFPTACYYAGRIYYELQDMPKALDYFQQAVDAIGQRQDGNSLKLRKVCHSQMGYIFYYQRLYDEATVQFRHSVNCAKELGDILGLAYGYRDLAMMSEALDNYHLALTVYRQSAGYAKMAHSQRLQLSVAAYMANCYRHLNQYDSACTYIRYALDHVSMMDKSALFSNAAKIYYDCGMTDSALYYFQQIERVGGVYAKEVAYKYLLKLTLDSNHLGNAHLYYANYLLYEDSVRRITQTETVARANALYN